MKRYLHILYALVCLLFCFHNTEGKDTLTTRLCWKRAIGNGLKCSDTAYSKTSSWAKKYVKANHLSNTRVVLSDRVIGGKADIVAAYDYYPFGLISQRFEKSGSEAKHLFNGKEINKEWAETYDYGERTYDPRLGRFLSVDPIAIGYPMLTPYQFASNTPIQAIDLDGLEMQFYQIDSYNKNGKPVLKKLSEDDVFSVVLTVVHQDVEIKLKLSDFGVQQKYVYFKGDWHLIPDGYDVNNIPPLEDKSWEESGTYGEFRENLEAAVRLIGYPKDLKNSLKNINSVTKNLKSERRKAVRDAWKQEKELVEKTGRGTRDWTKGEKKELLETGKVKGYKGHHTNNVKDNPGEAGNPDNITFKTQKEHLDAHDGNWKNPTSGELINRKELMEQGVKE